MKRRQFVIAGVGATFTSFLARGQQPAWPTRPVRLIVPWAAGGAADIIARTVAQKLSERWGQQVVVENKPGGTTIVGATEAARAAPDGYTLFQPIAATMTTNQFMYSKLPYDPLRDFTPITILASVPLVVMASAKAPGKTLPDIIDIAKKTPDTVTWGASAGGQVQSEQWMRDWNVKFRYVPYKSAVDTTKALLGNEIDLAVDGVAQNLDSIKAGKIRGLAVNTPRRMSMLPDVATMDELKLKHAEPQIWHALVAPAGLSPELQRRIYADVQAVLAMPDVKDKLRDLGLETSLGVTPDDFMKKVRAESAVVGPLVKELGLQVN